MLGTNYLVIYRTTMDDVPVRLFGHQERDEALVLAGKLATVEKFHTPLPELGNADAEPHAVVVLRFEDGKPAEVVASISLWEE